MFEYVIQECLRARSLKKGSRKRKPREESIKIESSMPVTERDAAIGALMKDLMPLLAEGDSSNALPSLGLKLLADDVEALELDEGALML